MVEVVDSKGNPRAPRESVAKWRSQCGAIVREYVSILVDKWSEVTNGEKVILWSNMKARIIFPDETHEAAKKATFATMSKRWKDWKSELNTTYVQKGCRPEDLGKIEPAD